MVTQTDQDYQAFLASKRIVVQNVGIDVDPDSLHPALFDWQRRIVHWALRRGRAALFEDCGLGKTPQQLEWANQIVRHVGGSVLILAPLAVSQQTVREGHKFGIPVTICKTVADVRPGGINVTNYERLHHFAPDAFVGLVADECFPGETPIDVLSIDKSLEWRYIRDVRPGDRIVNAQGEDRVKAIYKRRINRAVRLSISGRAELTCSENHPFFTLHGWRCAQDLRPGNYVMETATAVRLVRKDVLSKKHGAEDAALLRSILLSEMENEHTGVQGEGSYSRGCSEEGCEEERLAQERRPRSKEGNGEGCGAQANGKSRNEGEGFIPIAIDGAQTFRAWGKWNWFDGPAADFEGCSWRRLDTGICFVTGPTDSGLSRRLQARLGQSRAQDQHRSGRQVAPQSQGRGPEERCQAGFARVDRIEVLEQGHPELERHRDGDGHVYFYDLKAARHPSFSVSGLLVHNSSILKGFDGIIRKQITDFGRQIPYRLACTATPAPNDLLELTNHAEFLEIMTGKEILALFFIQDGNTTHKWKLKGHARQDFWRWMASWSVAVRRPSDLGYEDGAFILPELRMHQVTVDSPAPTTTLFPVEALTLLDRRTARRESIGNRVQICADLVNGNVDPWIVWCDLNAESHALAKVIPGAVEIVGSDTPEYKEQAIVDFCSGKTRVIVSKPSITGFGLNLQHCAHMAFVGLSDSYEQFYQAVRRCWRFGQTRQVDVYVITAETEGAVVRNIERKEIQANEMMDEIVRHMADFSLGRAGRDEMEYRTDEVTGDGWTLYLGDCIEMLDRVETESVGLTVFSPPFPGMYAYTNSARDMGNVKSIEQMISQFAYLIGPDKLLRVTMPGRSCCIHLTQAVAFKGTDGYIGMKDFRGAVIRTMEDAGWVYYGEVCIDKDPQLKAVRTKDQGLLFKSLAGDSARMHMALADYLLQFKKPGDNPIPIRAGVSVKYGNPNGWITNDEWIEWAAPVWYRHSPGYPGGIRDTHVLNARPASENDDQKHLCPLQLDVIERAVKLWSAPGDLVLSPFAGIGSEGYMAVKLNRRFVGIELKESYWLTAIKNLRDAEQQAKAGDLFGWAATQNGNGYGEAGE